MAQKMQVEIESKQIQDLKKSNHQDTLKVISAIEKISSHIDNLSYQIKVLGDELSAFREAYAGIEKDENVKYT